MTTLPFGGPMRLSTIRNALGSGDPQPYHFSDYRPGSSTGYVPVGLEGYPRGIKTVIPSSGPYSFGNFYGASRFSESFLGYLPTFYDNVGTLDVVYFGGRVGVDDTWYPRLSTIFLEFTTGPLTTGYTLRLEGGQGFFSASASYFKDVFSKWWRYFRIRNFGLSVTETISGNVVGTVIGDAREINSTVSSEDRYRSLGGPYYFNLNPNTAYRVHYYLEFLGDASRGYLASRYVGGKWFYGSTTGLVYAYLTNK